jgi:hypothetical protein
MCSSIPDQTLSYGFSNFFKIKLNFNLFCFMELQKKHWVFSVQSPRLSHLPTPGVQSQGNPGSLTEQLSFQLVLHDIHIYSQCFYKNNYTSSYFTHNYMRVQVFPIRNILWQHLKLKHWSKLRKNWARATMNLFSEKKQFSRELQSFQPCTVHLFKSFYITKRLKTFPFWLSTFTKDLTFMEVSNI